MPLVSVDGRTLAGDISQAANNYYTTKRQAEQTGLQERQLENQEKQQEVDNQQKNSQLALAQKKFEAEEQDKQKAASQQQQIQQWVQIAGDPNAPADQQQQAQLNLLAAKPEIVKQINEAHGIRTKEQQDSAYRDANAILSAPPEQRPDLINKRAEQIKARGGDPKDTLSLLNLPPEQQDNALRWMMNINTPAGELQKQNTPSNAAKMAQEAGYVPGTPEYQEFIRQQALKPQSQVNVNSKNDSAQAKGFGEAQARRYEDISKKADNAAVILGQADTLLAINPKTGALEPSKAKIANLLSSAGFGDLAKKVANGSEADAVKAISTALTIGKLKENVGVQTDFDFKKAEETIAALGDTPEGFQFKVATLKAIAQRQIEQRDFIDKVVAEQQDQGGSPDLAAAMKQWRDHIKDIPNISQTLKKDGLPVYYWQAKQAALDKYPDITDEEFNEQWKQQNARKKQ